MIRGYNGNTLFLHGNAREVGLELELTRIFVKVAQLGSFTKAANALKISKSNVSKAVGRLENETGTTLVMRTTRTLTLTDAGRTFFEASLGPILQLEEAQKSLYGHDEKLSGLVRITAPEDLGAYVVAPAIALLSRQHPNLFFEFWYTNEVIDLVRDGFDLAVRVGKAQDSRMKIKSCGDVILIPVASDTYLKAGRKIVRPEDLKDHVCLALNYKNSSTLWTLQKAKEVVPVEIRSKITTNQMTSLLKMALCGGGVALIPNYIAQPHLENGDLVRVLPQWESPAIPVSIITPLPSTSSARLKVAVETIETTLKTALKRGVY